MNEPAPLCYENRRGQVYYLQEVTTPTGKPKYYAGRKLTGKPLDSLPQGYEWRELPETAQVVVRRIQPSAVTEFERARAEAIVRRVSGLTVFAVEIERNSLVVYTPATNRREIDRLIGDLAGPMFKRSPSRVEAYVDESLKRSQFVKMLRFTLEDPDERTYRTERWCFLGSIDNWFPLMDGFGPLEELVEAYAPHLDEESFFDLM